MLHIVPLKSNDQQYVISHQNITRNKLLEQKAERLSLEDPLTDLYNRRGFNIFSKEEFSRAIRHQTSITMLVIDVDHFKHYNDKYGHHAGDKCLTNIAAIIKMYARRPGDIAARMGGDEFVILLSHASNMQGLKVASSIREKIISLQLFTSVNQQVTVSIGVATIVPQKGSDVQELLYKEADSALYVAKKRRNTVYMINRL